MKISHVSIALMLSLCVLVGCDDNEPVAPVTPDEPIEQPGNQDDQDEPDDPTPTPPLEEEEVRGAWISLDPELGWFRMQFNADGTYQMLMNENANSKECPRASEGAFNLDPYERRISYTVDSQVKWSSQDNPQGALWSVYVLSNDISCLNIHIVEETGMVDYDGTIHKDDFDWTGTLNRIISTIDLKIGESVIPDYSEVRSKNGKTTYTPLCNNGEIEIDPVSGKITARQQGLFYVEVEGDKGKGLIEIYSSDFQEMPFDHRVLFKAYKQTAVKPLTEEMGWKWDNGEVVETPYKFIKEVLLYFDDFITVQYLINISIELIDGLPGNLVYHVVRKDKNVVANKWDTYWYEGIACGRFPGYGYELTDSRRTVYISNPIVTYGDDGPEF